MPYRVLDVVPALEPMRTLEVPPPVPNSAMWRLDSCAPPSTIATLPVLPQTQIVGPGVPPSTQIVGPGIPPSTQIIGPGVAPTTQIAGSSFMPSPPMQMVGPGVSPPSTNTHVGLDIALHVTLIQGSVPVVLYSESDPMPSSQTTQACQALKEATQRKYTYTTPLRPGIGISAKWVPLSHPDGIYSTDCHIGTSVQRIGYVGTPEARPGSSISTGILR